MGLIFEKVEVSSKLYVDHVMTYPLNTPLNDALSSI